MVSNGDKWIRIFDIPDVSKHRRGFTIYKVISMLYPETCPDAITKVTVWKRFNDFKKLHREIKVSHKKLQLHDKYPSLPNSSFFKRFDNEVVQQRRQSILNFLDYVGSHPQLFTSNEFVKFFESSHTPLDQLGSNIGLIRADLNLPEEAEFYTAGNSDDEHTLSDSDSLTTLNSLQTSDVMSDSINHSFTSTSRAKFSPNTSISASHRSRNNSDSISISTTTDSITLLDGQIYPTPPHTPGISETYVQYIIDASIHVNIALELESDKKYEEAFLAYKTAIDILLKNGKDDKNYDRRQMVRYKTEKYLIRAEKIYSMHLSEEMRNLKQISEAQEDESGRAEHMVQRPISDLYKYKVVRIISSGMLVLHSELQQLFYIKVIHKTMRFLNENLILPEHVPYMVKLYNYYNCENALFLVLEYSSGVRLWDYIKLCSENSEEAFCNSDDQVLRQVRDIDLSDGEESERSYSDLINAYTSGKYQKASGSKCDIDNATTPVSDDEEDRTFEKVDMDDLVNSNRSLMDEPIHPNMRNIDSLLEMQQRQRPSEIDNGDFGDCERGFQESGGDVNKNGPSRRKFSEVSSFDDVDVTTQGYLVPLENVVKWSAQLLLALEKLHDLGIVCCDLSSRNILITDSGGLMLTYMCNVSDLYDALNKGESQHLAPEIYSFLPVTSAVDWWCYGAILYELLVGMPFSDMHPDGLSSSAGLKIPRFVSAEGRSLLKQLLTLDPNSRLGAGVNGIDNLKSHPFFSSVCWDELMSSCT